MRQHLYTLAGGIAAIALFTGILYAGAVAIRDRETAATPELVLETPDMTDFEATPDQADDEVPLGPGAPSGGAATTGEQPQGTTTTEKAARAIEPQQFGLPDTVTSAPLERVEPRAPLSEPKKEAKAAGPTVLYRPVAVAAGVIQFDKLTLQIDGIEPEQAERTCESGGKSWPCGIVARTAFRNFLRARAVSCDLPEAGPGPSATASCTLGGQDLATWLVDNGWATPVAGSSLEKRADAARQAKLGFYGDDPRDLSHTPMTFDDPTLGLGVDASQPDL